MIRENGHIQQKDTALKLGISKERVGHIYQPSWIPKSLCQVNTRNLIDEMNAERARVPREPLGHFEEKVVRFIWLIVTGDET